MQEKEFPWVVQPRPLQSYSTDNILTLDQTQVVQCTAKVNTTSCLPEENPRQVSSYRITNHHKITIEEICMHV